MAGIFLARVFVSLKPTVSDPQGQTIQSGLQQLGFDTVRSVRAGKYMEVLVEEESQDEAAQRVREMCDKLLANPVIEDYRVELEQVGDA